MNVRDMTYWKKSHIKNQKSQLKKKNETTTNQQKFEKKVNNTGTPDPGSIFSNASFFWNQHFQPGLPNDILWKALSMCMAKMRLRHWSSAAVRFSSLGKWTVRSVWWCWCDCFKTEIQDVPRIVLTRKTYGKSFKSLWNNIFVDWISLVVLLFVLFSRAIRFSSLRSTAPSEWRTAASKSCTGQGSTWPSGPIPSTSHGEVQLVEEIP